MGDGKELIVPSCEDCLLAPEILSSPMFYCRYLGKMKQTGTETCANYLPRYSFKEFFEKYKHI